MRTVAGTRPLPPKRCPKCREWKPRDAEHFYRSGGGWYSYCKSCHVSGVPNSKRNFEKLRALKDGQPCMDCDVPYPSYVLDYDHRPGEEKIDAVARLCSAGKSWKTILAEIAKCDLICANCHRERTWLRQQTP
jgi:hypothetical protein